MAKAVRCRFSDPVTTFPAGLVKETHWNQPSATRTPIGAVGTTPTAPSAGVKLSVGWAAGAESGAPRRPQPASRAGAASTAAAPKARRRFNSTPSIVTPSGATGCNPPGPAREPG